MARPPPLKRSAVPLRWSAVRNILYRERLAQRENENRRRAFKCLVRSLAFSFQRTPSVKKKKRRNEFVLFKARAKFFFFNRRFPWFTLFLLFARPLAGLRARVCSFAARLPSLPGKASQEGEEEQTQGAHAGARLISSSKQQSVETPMLARSARAAAARLQQSLW